MTSCVEVKIVLIMHLWSYVSLDFCKSYANCTVAQSGAKSSCETALFIIFRVCVIFLAFSRFRKAVISVNVISWQFLSLNVRSILFTIKVIFAKLIPGSSSSTLAGGTGECIEYISTYWSSSLESTFSLLAIMFLSDSFLLCGDFCSSALNSKLFL